MQVPEIAGRYSPQITDAGKLPSRTTPSSCFIVYAKAVLSGVEILNSRSDATALSIGSGIL